MILTPVPPARIIYVLPEKIEEQRGQVKTGEEYRTLMENTAARVEKWPRWKLGEKSTRI